MEAVELSGRRAEQRPPSTHCRAIEEAEHHGIIFTQITKQSLAVLAVEG
jgi:hypothetical protein